MSEMVTCPVCGFRFDPDQLSVCPQCPLHSACNMVCCPNCGTSTLLVEKSSWVQRVKRLFGEPAHDPLVPKQR